MAEDIKQLTEYLAEKFDGIDKKFEKIDERFDGVDKKFDEVDKKFIGIEKRFDGVDKRLDNFEKDVDDKFIRLFDVFATKDDLQEIGKEIMTQNDKHQLLMAIDSYAHKADAFFQELVALSNQTRRHEKWIQMLAEKLNVKLEY